MDALTLLKKDHRLVEGIFMKLEKNKSKKEQERWFGEVKRELDAHADIEENIFYPQVKEQDQTKKLAEEFYHEHAEVKKILKDMSGMSQEDQEWTKKLESLKKAVQHHVKEEEQELFPKIEQMFDKEKLQELGQELEKNKKELMAKK